MSTEQTQRPKFYEEQFLGAADLTAAVDYGRIQQARHALGAHMWGIAAGLQLKETPQPGGAVTVHLLPGYAWDGYGRPIVVLTPSKIPEEKFSSIKFDSTIDSGAAGQKGRLIRVWLRYDESATRNPRPGFEVCKDEDQYSRIQEKFSIEIGEQTLTERYSGLTIAAKTMDDAKKALQTFDPAAPLVHDESVPNQSFPESEARARWLIPLGYVRWLPVENQPGHFVARDDGGADKDSDKIRRIRRYIGVVTEEIGAADRAIRLRDRAKDPATSAFHPPTQEQITNSNFDLVWVEGNMCVEGDARLFNGKLDFRDQSGQDSGIPLYFQRADAGVGRAALRAVIGRAAAGANVFAFGPLDNANAFVPKVIVRDDGRVGIGPTPPAAPLHISGPGNQFLDISSTDALLASYTRLMAVTSNNQVESQLQFKNILRFVAPLSGTSLMTLLESGNIGIGTLAPAQKFHVVGNRLRLESNDASKRIELRVDGSAVDLQSETSDLYLRSNGGASNNRVIINPFPADGNVGIGTRTPEFKLDVSERMRVRQGDTGSAGIWFHQTVPNSNRAFVGMVNDDLVGFWGNTGAGWGMVMNTTSGNVGIGAGAPAAKLQIGGGAIMPAIGNSGAAGIQFPSNPGGGGGDEAFIRYFVEVGERTKLLIGINNDADDTLGFHQAGVERMTIRAGRVGIGTTDPQNTLHVNGIAIKPGGGPWGATSDIRLKKNVEPLTGALSKLLELRGVRYEWKEPEKMGNLTGTQMGLIAQEAEEVFPEWISTGRDGFKQINIRGFEALTIETVRELKTEIDNLKARLDKLGTKPPTTKRKRTASKKETAGRTPTQGDSK